MGRASATAKVRGFVRGALVDEATGAVQMGAWHENVITQIGWQHYLVGNLISSAGIVPSHLALGSVSNAHASTDTVVSGQYSLRAPVTASVVASKTAQFLASFAATDNTGTVANCGLHGSSGTTVGSMMCAATYASSVKSSTQTLALTYQVVFA